MDTAEGERLRRWRLVLGEEAQASCGLAGLSPEDRQMDEALAALYEADSRHSLRGGSGASSPRVARWLGDIRRFFPSSVVQVMQKDAFERLNLHSMLLQPEMLESVQPDVNLVSTLMSLRGIIPEKTKETARLVVRKVVDALMKQLEEPMRTAVSGALNRAVRNRRPRHAEIDWNRTIRANLKHWQQEYKTIVPETLIGYGRKSQRVQREIILCIDQSGSMASSVVYSSSVGAVMFSGPGAGGPATASAVLADVIDIVRNPGRSQPVSWLAEPAALCDPEEFESPFFFRTRLPKEACEQALGPVRWLPDAGAFHGGFTQKTTRKALRASGLALDAVWPVLA